MKIHVVACDIFKPELDALFRAMKEGGAERYTRCEVEVTYLSALLHSDFDDLARAVTEALDAHPGGRALLLYGSKCHPAWDGVLAGRDVTRFAESNCIHLVSGRSAELGASRDFHMTSGWFVQWPGFRGEDASHGLTPEKCRAMFAHHCDRALFHDTGVRPPSGDELAYFEETTGLRVETETVGLEIFAGKFLEKLRLRSAHCAPVKKHDFSRAAGEHCSPLR